MVMSRPDVKGFLQFFVSNYLFCIFNFNITTTAMIFLKSVYLNEAGLKNEIWKISTLPLDRCD